VTVLIYQAQLYTGTRCKLRSARLRSGIRLRFEMKIPTGIFISRSLPLRRFPATPIMLPACAVCTGRQLTTRKEVFAVWRVRI
jgi:hypothetical protein